VKIRAEATKLAVFCTLGLLIAGLLYLTLGRVSLGPSTGYSAVMSDISGLESGDLVKIAGVRVGQVDRLDFEAGNRVRVRFHVASGQHLTDQTRLMVRYENLLGDRYVELAQPAAKGQQLAPGATIPMSMTTPALDLDVLLNGFRPLFQGLSPDQVNELATNIVDTLQGRGGTVQELLAQTASLTNGLADNDKAIGSLITNLDTVLGSLDQHDTQLRQTIGQLRSLVSGLAADRDPIVASVTSINRFTGTLAALLSEVRAPFAGTLAAVRRVAALLNANADELDKTLKRLPGVYRHLGRVASHGTFFDFYLCSVQVQVSAPNGPVIKSPVVTSQARRCQ